MAVFRVEKTKDFTIMSNHHLRNTELSLKAKGLLSLMLSLPEDWDYTTKGLAHICKDGVDSITTALKELERHGYLTRQRLRYDNGQLGDIEYTIHEQPVSTENTGLSPKRENPRQVKPEQAKPKQAEPEQENPAQLNTNPLKTKKSKKDKSITYPSIYQGTLAIAFGARGSGNAAAHYEPLRTVINLTKMHGAGSLAHEWWHGLDDYLGTKMGTKGMLSEQPRLYAPFQKLIDTMKYKPETPEQAAKRTEAQTERTRKNAASWLDSSVLASLKRYGNKEQMETYAVLREAFLSGEPGSVEQISAFKKNVTGRVIPKSERERLEIFERMLSGMQAQEAPQIGRTETDFYRNSVRMGKECEKDGGYWDSNVEMTARAFACYIKDKLPYTSDYLAGHADCALTLVSGKDGEMEVLKAFPVGEERRAINAVFDEIIQDLKREQLLTHADVTFPLSVSELREAADGQLSMFGVGRPSVMDQLAANRPADKKSPAQTVSRKNHEPEI